MDNTISRTCGFVRRSLGDKTCRRRGIVVELDEIVVLVERYVFGQWVVRPLRYARGERERFGEESAGGEERAGRAKLAKEAASVPEGFGSNEVHSCREHLTRGMIKETLRRRMAKSLHLQVVHLSMHAAQISTERNIAA